MIDYLIYDQTKYWIKKGLFLKHMNFLIFRDFFEFISNFY